MTSIPAKMKTNIFVTLLFVAVAHASLDGASDDDGTGICPGEYIKSHPEFHEKKKELMEKYGFPDFSKLKSCSSDGKCDKDRKCCQTPCGMKCMKPVFEGNAWETMEQIQKEIGTGVDDKPYEVTEEDKKYGMCPENYIKTHPEVKEKMEKKWRKKHSNKECKHGEQCSQKHSHHKKHKHFKNFTAAADCSVDGDCSNNMRCCNTICGKKCVKPVFTTKDLKASLFDKDEEKENRKKREVNDDEQDNDHDDEIEHSKDHGKGLEHGKGHRKGGEHRKGQGKGGEHGKCHGKGGKCGKGHGKGEEHGKGQKKGAEQGKGNRRGAGNGKGHGKGMKHGKGQEKAQEHQVQMQDGDEHFRQKRSINSGGQIMPNNEGDNGMHEGSQNVKGKGKDKKKGKGKKKKGKGQH